MDSRAIRDADGCQIVDEIDNSDRSFERETLYTDRVVCDRQLEFLFADFFCDRKKGKENCLFALIFFSSLVLHLILI